MEYIYIGDLIGTHGIKGEVKISSNFQYKDQIFKSGLPLYIGKKKEELIIKTYRIHKNYDLITFNGIDNINDVLIYKGELVYANRKDIKAKYFNEDLIGMEVYDGNQKIGKVSDIENNTIYDILIVTNNDKRYLIPNISEFIKEINLEKKQIIINNIKGLIDEN